MRETPPAEILTLAYALARAVRRRLILHVGPVVLGGLLLGCIPDQRHDIGGVVMVPPPAARVDIASAPPAPGYVWLSGYWAWVGDRYDWVPGHWASPRPGRHWVPHVWVRQGDGWRMKPGHWERS